MKVPVNPRRWLDVANLLVVAGALLLVRPAADFAAGWRAQSRGLPDLAASAPTRSISNPSPSPREGDPVGRLELPRLGVDLVVFEGTSDATLRKGPGHLSGTVRPGAPGNCVIAGHRDTFFRRLARARESDLVRLFAAGRVTTYRLEGRRVVRPEQLDVLGPTSDGRLTLVTCYPFRWIGDAPYRLVWTARPVDANAGTIAAR
ncbi:MAG TPA: class D sortase [Thermoanaerobaculia bacterium]|nr:class D sortase [Thermoanaerobaculia bacterium]